MADVEITRRAILKWLGLAPVVAPALLKASPKPLPPAWPPFPWKMVPADISSTGGPFFVTWPEVASFGESGLVHYSVTVDSVTARSTDTRPSRPTPR